MFDLNWRYNRPIVPPVVLPVVLPIVLPIVTIGVGMNRLVGMGLKFHHHSMFN